MRFLTAIHDVWPGNYPLVVKYLQTLRSLGVENVALLVVPNYHGEELISKNAEFLEWLKSESERGAEIFLHGYYHLRPEFIEPKSNLPRSFLGNWINQKWVNNEAEFLGLAIQEKEKLLQLGLMEFERAMDSVGKVINPIGFVAPTWFGSPPATMIQKNKLSILETRFFIKNLLNQKSKFAPPLAWEKTQANQIKLVGGSLWPELLVRLSLLKIAIHPGDFGDSQTLKTIDKILQQRTSITYQNCF